MYSQIVMDHFTNPRNAGVLEDADGVGEVGNPVCGDMMTFYIKVRDGRLADVKFNTFGCVAAIAVSSMVSEMAKGKTLEEAKKITNKAVADALDGLPKNKLHCSNLGAEALKLAIRNYEEKQALGPSSHLQSASSASKPDYCTHCDTEDPVGAAFCMECDNDTGCELIQVK